MTGLLTIGPFVAMTATMGPIQTLTGEWEGREVGKRGGWRMSHGGGRRSVIAPRAKYNLGGGGLARSRLLSHSPPSRIRYI